MSIAHGIPAILLLAFNAVLLPITLSQDISPASTAADTFLGSGVKAGEMTDHSAIVLVRLTSAAGQDAEGLIPGKSGQARLVYGIEESLRESRTTTWQTAKADAD